MVNVLLLRSSTSFHCIRMAYMLLCEDLSKAILSQTLEVRRRYSSSSAFSDSTCWEHLESTESKPGGAEMKSIDCIRFSDILRGAPGEKNTVDEGTGARIGKNTRRLSRHGLASVSLSN